MGLLVMLLVYLTIRKAVDIRNRKIINQYIEKYHSIFFFNAN